MNGDQVFATPLPRGARPLCIGLIVLFAAGPPLLAATITVDNTTCTLVDAVVAANTDAVSGSCPAGSGPDVIELTANVGLTSVNNFYQYANNGTPVVQSDITLQGGGYTIQRDPGAPNFRLFSVAVSGTLTMNDVTLSNGLAQFGGAIGNRGTTHLTLTNVSGNASYSGGGGILNAPASAVLTLTNSTVSGNSNTSFGGGIYNIYGTVSLTNSTVSGNSTSVSGGGIYSFGPATLNVTNSTISGNSAVNGAGLRNSHESVLTMTNVTIADNSASTAGGGISNVGGALANVRNSVIATSPSGGNCSGAIVDNGNNFDDDGTCGIGFGTITGLDGTLADNGGPTRTHALSAGSSAIDAAGACGLATDQRGTARSDGACDSGAYEYQSVPQVPTWSVLGLILLCLLLLGALFLVDRVRADGAAAM